MNTVVFIMADGRATRFNGVCKQLLPVGDGETIIERIIRQVNERGEVPLVVTRNNEILNAGLSGKYATFSTAKNETICESLEYSTQFWTERNIVLLGDVIYSKRVMDAIFSVREPIRVFADFWERFAIVFRYEVSQKVIDSLRIAKGYVSPNSEVMKGKLGFFYRHYCDHPMTREIFPFEHEILYQVNDWTVDIDKEAQYENAVREIINSGVLDDRKVAT